MRIIILEKQFFGHPRGLMTLFFTEMWERFSYYGMRALLLLYMVSAVEQGGMGFDAPTSAAIYGLYTMLVYLMALPGGWLADKVLGLRNAIFYGGIIIAFGHFLMVFESKVTFFLGLLCVAVGTGLLKPNISVLVGKLYTDDDQSRRDAGYSIFFLGINIGAFIAPFITGYLGEYVNWHYGFGIAGIGMVIGVIQFMFTEEYLGEKGSRPVKTETNSDHRVKVGLVVVLLVLGGLVYAIASNILQVNVILVAEYSAILIGGSTILYFLYLFLQGELNLTERKNVTAIAMFFMIAIVFYMAYEQQGSTLNLFAKRYTNLFVGSFEMPASWLQAIPAVAVIIFAPIFAWIWIFLSSRGSGLTTPVKLSLGLLFMGLGYVVMIGASAVVITGSKPTYGWLILTYVFHTFGEICLYPVGLSAVSRLAPKRFSGQMMGVWFMSLALGNLMAGILAGQFDEKAIATDPGVLTRLFMSVAIISVVTAVIVFLLRNLIRRMEI